MLHYAAWGGVGDAGSDCVSGVPVLMTVDPTVRNLWEPMGGE